MKRKMITAEKPSLLDQPGFYNLNGLNLNLMNSYSLV